MNVFSPMEEKQLNLIYQSVLDEHKRTVWAESESWQCRQLGHLEITCWLSAIIYLMAHKMISGLVAHNLLLGIIGIVITFSTLYLLTGILIFGILERFERTSRIIFKLLHLPFFGPLSLMSRKLYMKKYYTAKFKTVDFQNPEILYQIIDRIKFTTKEERDRIYNMIQDKINDSNKHSAALLNLIDSFKHEIMPDQDDTTMLLIQGRLAQAEKCYATLNEQKQILLNQLVEIESAFAPVARLADKLQKIYTLANSLVVIQNALGQSEDNEQTIVEATQSISNFQQLCANALQQFKAIEENAQCNENAKNEILELML